jgi:hypothetical protein
VVGRPIDRPAAYLHRVGASVEAPAFWRNALGMRLVRVGLRLAGGGELPQTRRVAYRNRRRTT